MDIIAGRLATIHNEIRQVENQKLQCERMLGLFWEHLPALDPEDVGRRMQFLRDRIRSIENQKRALLAEQQDLIVRAAISNRGGNGNNGERGELRRVSCWLNMLCLVVWLVCAIIGVRQSASFWMYFPCNGWLLMKKKCWSALCRKLPCLLSSDSYNNYGSQERCLFPPHLEMFSVLLDAKNSPSSS